MFFVSLTCLLRLRGPPRLFALLAFLAPALALALLALALAMALALWSSILVDLGLATGTRETDLVS